MKKPPRARLKQTLIDVAEAAILKDGFQSLRARALTEAAGCALGALYTVFPDMDALIFGVKIGILDRLDAQVSRALAGLSLADPERGIAALLAMATAYLDFASDDRRRWEVLFQHHLADSQDLPDWYQARLADIFARIDAPLRVVLPDLSRAASLRLAHTLFSATHGVVVLGIEGKLGRVERIEIAARIEMLVRGAIAGIAAHPSLADHAPSGRQERKRS